jgi:hypothetical protein
LGFAALLSFARGAIALFAAALFSVALLSAALLSAAPQGFERYRLWLLKNSISQN